MADAYYFLNVKLKDKTVVKSPQMRDRADAEEQLGKIRAVLGSSDDPGLDWIAVQGDDVVSAHIEEKHPPSMPRIG